MRKSSIVFENLRAEMSRKNIGLAEIAEVIGCNRDTISRKLSMKSPINLDEAFKIQSVFFPNEDLRYLFETAENKLGLKEGR